MRSFAVSTYKHEENQPQIQQEEIDVYSVVKANSGE